MSNHADATIPSIPTEPNDVDIPDAPDVAINSTTTTTEDEDIHIGDAPDSGSHDHNDDDANSTAAAAAASTSEQQPPVETAAEPVEPAEPAEPPKEEPLGRRAHTLSVFFPKALEKCLSMISYPKLAECFPTLAGARPEVLARIHESMIENMRGKTTTEFATILSSRNVIPKLNTLDHITTTAATLSSAGGPPPTPPSTLSPQDVVTAHIRPVLTAAINRAERQLVEVQQRNDELIRDVEMQRKEMERLVGVLEEGRRGMAEAVRGVESAVGVVGE
ncbi:Nnf1-domain-containing protein [Pyronema omphalodes]|nr:Nnf1-domain-containing protein [Pyronema omphalodes]